MVSCKNAVYDNILFVLVTARREFYLNECPRCNWSSLHLERILIERRLAESKDSKNLSTF